MIFLLTFVIPKITGVFADNKATLPFLTIALLTVSALLRKGWWLLLILVAAAVFGYRRLTLRESFLAARDRWLLRLPLVGNCCKPWPWHVFPEYWAFCWVVACHFCAVSISALKRW